MTDFVAQARVRLSAEGWNLNVLDAPQGPLPVAVSPGPVSLDRVLGALTGVAIGDALAGPAEGKDPQTVRQRYRWLDRLYPHHKGPAGTVTDDTQLTTALVESLADCGSVDPEDLAARFPAVRLVGGGKATIEAFNRLHQGVPWLEAGTASAGNGSCMRAHPVGLAFENPASVAWGALLQGLVTHRDASASAAAILVARFTWLLARATPEAAAGREAALLEWLAAGIRGLERPLPARKNPEWRYTLHDATLELRDFVGRPRLAADRYWNGAFVLESLPTSLAVAVSLLNHPAEALVLAGDLGHDADTVGAIAGGWLGALHGLSGLKALLPGGWFEIPALERLQDAGRRLQARGPLDA